MEWALDNYRGDSGGFLLEGLHVFGESVNRVMEVVEVPYKAGVLVERHSAHGEEGLSYLVSFDSEWGLDCGEGSVVGSEELPTQRWMKSGWESSAKSLFPRSCVGRGR